MSWFSPFFASVDSVLLDCDGVLWTGTSAVPGAADAVAALRTAGKRVFFVYVHQLASHGITAAEDEVVASAFVTAQYLVESGLLPGDTVYVIGESGLHDELRAVGLITLGLDDSSKHAKLAEFTRASLNPAVKAVIVGMDTKFNYFKVATAASYLRYIEGCRFIATNTDRTFPSTDMLLPGSGTLVHMVSFAAEREPDVVVGKPSPKMLEVLAAYAGLDLSRAVMVGDRLNTDIEFGKRQGLHTILVLTGVNTREDAEAEPADSFRRPDHILASLADLTPLIAAMK